jgi:hypothetical protein
MARYQIRANPTNGLLSLLETFRYAVLTRRCGLCGFQTDTNNRSSSEGRSLCQAFTANASKLTMMTMACALHGSSFMVRGDEDPGKVSIRLASWRDSVLYDSPRLLITVVDLKTATCF